MVGSAIARRLQRDGYANLVTRTSQELDLRNQAGGDQFFAQEEPVYVFLAAAHVGGIHANNTPSLVWTACTGLRAGVAATYQAASPDLDALSY